MNLVLKIIRGDLRLIGLDVDKKFIGGWGS